MSVRPDIRAVALRHAPLFAAGAVLVWHSLRYGFVTDDAYISLVYSKNLAAHGELVFNPGLPPVEGYTNFLWTFLLGGLGWLGLPLESTALVLGTGFALGTMALVFRLSARLVGQPTPHDVVAPGLLALSAGYACWSSGGLETQMFTFWVTLALTFSLEGAADPRRFRQVGWALAMAAMTRPEGLLVAAVIALHRIGWNVADRRRLVGRDELIAAAWFLAAWAPWYAWRWWYYGWPLPNTAYVKAAGDAAPGYDARMREAGVYYVGQWLRQTALVWGFPLVLVGFLWARPTSPRIRFATLGLPLAASYLAYTISVGGDFMGLHRFLMPLFPIAALGASLGLCRLGAWLPVGRVRRVGGWLLAIGLLAAWGVQQQRLTTESTRFGNFKSDHGIDTPAFLAVYAHDRALIGQAMAPCFRPGDFAIFGGAGAKPFFAGVPGIDVYGLVSERIAHEVPRTRPRAGHNKWAPDPLLLEHDPTFVFSCYDLHDRPDNPRMPCSLAWWRRKGFVPVTMRVPGLLERGEYYTFLAREARGFRCPGVVPTAGAPR